jgi:hypothetical protein
MRMSPHLPAKLINALQPRWAVPELKITAKAGSPPDQRQGVRTPPDGSKSVV